MNLREFAQAVTAALIKLSKKSRRSLLESSAFKISNLENEPWLEWLLKYEGEPEFTGDEPSPFVRECFKHTNYGDLDDTTPPSCAATLCAALELSGYSSPHSAAAFSFINYGSPCHLTRGTICVFLWPSDVHHVAVCLDPDRKIFIGGNQGHYLKRRKLNTRYLLATRWPLKF